MRGGVGAGLATGSAYLLDAWRSCHHRRVSSTLIAQGLAALRAGDAAAARRAFELALAERESGEAFEGLAGALYLEREYTAPSMRTCVASSRSWESRPGAIYETSISATADR
jgi:Tfp pilus assembly protein PilF